MTWPIISIGGLSFTASAILLHAAASALHATHDPADLTFAFTGDSSRAPGNVDGWVYREFDLTDYANITENDVPYERFDSSTLGHYLGTGIKDELKIHPTAGPNVYIDSSWAAGDVSATRYWEVQNLTESELTSPTGRAAFWWSGSVSLADDHKRPDANNFLHIPVADALAQASQGDTVTADWWEYADRYALMLTPITGYPGVGATNYPPAYDVNSGIAFTKPAATTHTFRLNVTTPDLLEVRGKWHHYQADITSFLNAANPVTDIEFAYSPVTEAGGTKDPWSDERYTRYVDDPGFAIDGFTISAYKVTNGQVTGKRDLLTTDDAWNLSVQLSCSSGLGGDSQALPCLVSPHPNARRNDIPLSKPRSFLPYAGGAGSRNATTPVRVARWWSRRWGLPPRPPRSSPSRPPSVVIARAG